MTDDKLQLRALSKNYGAVRAVDSVSISLQEGQMLALLGPSGCGKTTTLRMVAGLERPTGGEIVLDGQVLADEHHSVAPEHRGLGMVFQTYALWPHMTVLENVAYGLQRQRLSKAEVRARVDEVLALVGMANYVDRPATNLSGGQQQRVAVARALATRPKILLFDEPLSNLDAQLRETMRFEIRSLQKEHGITAIYVTHSQDEALAIADVVGVMKDGRMQQMAAPEHLYSRPRNRFVAGFVGLANVIAARMEQVSGGQMSLRLDNGTGFCAIDASEAAPRKPDEMVTVAIRPERIRIVRVAGSQAETAGEDGSLRLRGTVTAAIFTGNLIDYFVQVDGLAEPLRVQSLPPTVAGQGDLVDLSVSPAACILLED